MFPMSLHNKLQLYQVFWDPQFESRSFTDESPEPGRFIAVGLRVERFYVRRRFLRPFNIRTLLSAVLHWDGTIGRHSLVCLQIRTGAINAAIDEPSCRANRMLWRDRSDSDFGHAHRVTTISYVVHGSEFTASRLLAQILCGRRIYHSIPGSDDSILNSSPQGCHTMLKLGPRRFPNL